jgi:cobalamin biosynthesis Co2+ chelatase CbiK
VKLGSGITVTKVTAHGDKKTIIIAHDSAFELSYEASIFLSAIIECNSDDSVMLRLVRAFPGVDERRLRNDFKEFVQTLAQQRILVNDRDS